MSASQGTHLTSPIKHLTSPRPSPSLRIRGDHGQDAFVDRGEFRQRGRVDLTAADLQYMPRNVTDVAVRIDHARALAARLSITHQFQRIFSSIAVRHPDILDFDRATQERLPAGRGRSPIDGAAIAAVTGIHTITDFRSCDIALGGQGAPVVPIGEKLLFPEYDLFLNIGGIANISIPRPEAIGFDICPANRVLNVLAANTEKGYDEDGRLASIGSVRLPLLRDLNQFAYYRQSYPKSLSNDFGLKEILPLIENANLPKQDALRTYVEHIVIQISASVDLVLKNTLEGPVARKLLVTGGGAHNLFLMEQLKNNLFAAGIEVVIPGKELVDYKEALIIGLMGALRWREEENVISSVTGSKRGSINGAIWSS